LIITLFERKNYLNVEEICKISVKKPLFFYVDYALKSLAVFNEVTLSGLGSAISRVVTVGEILKNKNAIEYKKIQTLFSNPEDTISPKPKIEIIIVKGDDFENFKNQRLGLSIEKQKLRDQFDQAQVEFQESLMKGGK